MSLPHSMGKPRGLQTPIAPGHDIVLWGSAGSPSSPHLLAQAASRLIPHPSPTKRTCLSDSRIRVMGPGLPPTLEPCLCLCHQPAKMLLSGCSQWTLGTYIGSEGSKSGLRRAMTRATAGTNHGVTGHQTQRYPDQCLLKMCLCILLQTRPFAAQVRAQVSPGFAASPNTPVLPVCPETRIASGLRGQLPTHRDSSWQSQGSHGVTIYIPALWGRKETSGIKLEQCLESQTSCKGPDFWVW